MNSKGALKIIFAITIIGVLFSGTLSYQELLGTGVLACPSPGAPGTILGYPACVYGFFMFVILAIISGFSLVGSSHKK